MLLPDFLVGFLFVRESAPFCDSLICLCIDKLISIYIHTYVYRLKWIRALAIYHIMLAFLNLIYVYTPSAINTTDYTQEFRVLTKLSRTTNIIVDYIPLQDIFQVKCMNI